MTVAGFSPFRHLIHGVTALLWVGVWFGHFYLGTVGTEGTLEGMTTGYVDENWAEQHHNLWLEEVKRGGADTGKAEAEPAKPGAGEQPA